MNSLSYVITELFKNISCVSLHTAADNVFEAVEQKNYRSICSIDILKKKYTVYLKPDFEDVYRVLEYLNIKDEKNIEKDKTKCEGLNCEDCSGCSYNTLASLYNSRKVLEKYIDKKILENYIFIGGLSIEDKLIVPSPYRKYISYMDGKFLINSPVLELLSEKDCVNTNPATLLGSLFIDQYIPEGLKISNDVRKVYGIYKNNAVLWELKPMNGRYIWFYTILKDS